MIEAAILVIFPFCMAFAAVSDTLSMTIQNRVSLLLVASFAVIAPLTGMPWMEYGLHFAIAAAVLAVTFGLFAIGAMGGGDAKLLTGVTLWIGLNMQLMEYMVLSTILGGFLTLLVLKLRSSPMAVYGGQLEFVRRIADPAKGVPYGIALGIAGLYMFPETKLAVWALNSIAAGH